MLAAGQGLGRGTGLGEVLATEPPFTPWRYYVQHFTWTDEEIDLNDGPFSDDLILFGTDTLGAPLHD